MAVPLICDAARLTNLVVTPAAGGAYSLAVEYLLAVSKPQWRDVYWDGRAQRTTSLLAPGAALPTPVQVAALIRADARAQWGGHIDVVKVNDALY